MDQSVEDFLNKALAKKPAVQKRIQRREIYSDCHMVHRGGEWYDSCVDRVHYVDEIISIVATVASADVVVVKENQLKVNEAEALPRNARVSTESFKNCSDGITLTHTVALTVSATKSWSVEKSHSLTTSSGASVTLGGNIEFFNGSATVHWETALSVSERQTESFSTTETRSTTDTLLIPPRRAGDYYLIVYEQPLKIPFSATIIVDGALNENISGVSKASDMLSEAERTMLFDGFLHIQDASHGEMKIDWVDIKVACGDEINDVLHLIRREFTVPADWLSGNFLQDFAVPKAMLRDKKGHLKVTDEIGAPTDGRHFFVEYEVDEIRSDMGHCGFNDLGFPNVATWHVQHGTWREYLGGQQVSSAPGTIENFVACYLP